MHLLHVDAYRLPDLLIAHEDEIVELIAKDELRKLIRGARCYALGRGVHGRLHQLAALPRLIGGLRLLRLHADDLNRWVHGLRHDADARGAATAADGGHDDVDVRLRLGYFERERGHARDQEWLVRCVDVSMPRFFRQPLRVLAGVVERGAVEHDAGAEVAYRLDLGRVRALRHDDGHRHVEHAARVGNGLAVVAGGGGDDAATALVLLEAGHEVDAASNLERADGEVVLVLDVDLGAHELIEGGVGVQWGAQEVRRDRLSGIEHVLQGGYRKGGVTGHGIESTTQQGGNRRLL